MKVIFLILALFPLACSGQYLIEGTVDTSLQYTRVSLDILDEWNQFSSISDVMVLKTAHLDQDGSYRFEGNELSEKSGYYRIRYSKKKDGLSINWAKPNYTNFIFSNSDSIQVNTISVKSGNKLNQKFQKEIKIFQDFRNETLITKNERHKQLLHSKHQEHCISQIKNSKSGLLNAFNLFSSDLEIKNAPELFKKVHLELKDDSLRKQYASSLEEIIHMHEFNDLEKKSNWLFYALISSLLFNLFLTYSWFKNKIRTTEPTKSSLIETLTNKELEVIKLISEKKSNKEIAGKLYISDATVKTHINNIYRKLNVNSRKEAINLFNS